MKATKLHIESPAPDGFGFLFGYRPALCGRRKPTDYRMYRSSFNDEVSRRASRPFFAENQSKATCATCRAKARRMLESAEKRGRLHRSDARLLKKLRGK